MLIKKTLSFLIAVLMIAPLAFSQGNSGGGQPQEMLIKNATIMTASHGTIENGSILIRNGKIAAVGKDVKAGPNAKVIDAQGKYVTPGIIDCHSHTMIDGGVNEGTLSVTAMVRIQDVLDPEDIAIYRELAGGTTTINVLHGSANAIGGQNAVVKLKWGRPVDEMRMADAPRGIKFALGENPKRSNGARLPGAQQRYPNTRMGVEYTIREAFTQAKDYMREWDEYNARKAKGEDVIPPAKDLKLEELADILRGKVFVHSHSYRADEILMLIRLADEFGFKVRTFQHVLEGYKVAKEIAAHGAGGSTFSDWWAYKLEAYDAIPYNAAVMTKKGVTVTLNSDSDELARRLNFEAAKTIKYGGLTEEEALRTVTLNAAMQLGVQERIGSIDVGKDADLVIFNGHPFSVYTLVDTTIIEGQIYFDRSADIENREKNEKEKQNLLDTERKLSQPQQQQNRPGRPGRPGEKGGDQ